MNTFEKLVLRALSVLVRSAIWHNAFGSASEWNATAQKVVRDISEAAGQ